MLQSTEGVVKDTVFPSVDTIITSYLAHTHFETAKIEDLFLHGPLLSSLKVQSGGIVDTESTKNDEHLFLNFVLRELNSSISSWGEDHQLQNMLLILQHNVALKEKRVAEEKQSVGGDPNMMKLKNMKSKLKSLSKKAKASSMNLSEDKVTATKATEIERAQKEKDEQNRKDEAEAKAIEENMDCMNSDIELTKTSVSSVWTIGI